MEIERYSDAQIAAWDREDRLDDDARARIESALGQQARSSRTST
jgi:hypothetical protein